MSLDREEQDRERVPFDPAGSSGTSFDRARSSAGRRRRRADVARSHVVKAKLSDNEWTAAATGASRSGLALGAFVAASTLAAAELRPYAKPPSLAELTLRANLREIAETRTQVVRIGTLLNQAVAALNSTGEMPPGLPYLAGRVEIVLRQLDRQTAALMHRGA